MLKNPIRSIWSSRMITRIPFGALAVAAFGFLGCGDDNGEEDVLDVNADAEDAEDDKDRADADRAVGAKTTAVALAQNASVRVVLEGDWIRHEFTKTLPGSTQQEIIGERLIGRAGALGCGYSKADFESPGDLASGQIKVSREIAHNLATCVLRLETATLSEDEARTLGVQVREHEGMTVDEVASLVETPETHLMPRSATIGRYQKLYYEDPPKIDVTSVTARVRWSYNGTCVTWSKHSASWGWFSPSGWERKDAWWGNALSCHNGAWTSNAATYRNGKFCLSIDTWNRYNTNFIQGEPDGSSYYEWDAQKWGGFSPDLWKLEWIASSADQSSGGESSPFQVEFLAPDPKDELHSEPRPSRRWYSHATQ